MTDRFKISFDTPIFDPGAYSLRGHRYLANISIELNDKSVRLPNIFLAGFAKNMMSATLAVNFNPDGIDSFIVGGDTPGGAAGTIFLSSYGTDVRFGYDNWSRYGVFPDAEKLDKAKIKLLVFNRAVGEFYMDFLNYIYENTDGDDGFDEIFLNMNCFFNIR